MDDRAAPCNDAPVAGCTKSGSVFLVGMMGAGKTSVGRLLAQRLGKRFIDSDQEIEARCGVSIPLIFEIEGESGFRQRERLVIDELTQLPDIVLATGGGAVIDEHSRQRLRSRGLVIYLKASASEIWHRTRRDRSRPLLATADPQRRISELLAAREPLYADASHITVESTHESVRSMVARLMEMMQTAQGFTPAPATVACGDADRNGDDVGDGDGDGDDDRTAAPASPDRACAAVSESLGQTRPAQTPDPAPDPAPVPVPVRDAASSSHPTQDSSAHTATR